MTDLATKRTQAIALKRQKAQWKLAKRVEWTGTPDFGLVRKCFWTWPLGHRYICEPPQHIKKCVGCGKLYHASSGPGPY